MESPDSKLTRIGVFYDGGYYQAVTNYYKYSHERKAPLSIQGIHRFAEHRVAEEEHTDVRYCRVVDAHYFRGRYSVESVVERNNLENERRFDDVLMRAGIITHYLPRSQRDEEKGIDVWFALEAYELAVYKRFNVLVLLACDGDYVPLVRKLNTLGTRVMLLGWDFKYTDTNGRERETRTAQGLIDEVSYYVPMQTEIETNLRKKDPVIEGLFYHSSTRKEIVKEISEREEAQKNDKRGCILRLEKGYGFISDSDEPKNRFFYYGDVVDDAFNALQVDDEVEFTPSANDKGPSAINVRVIINGSN